eukprot:COSAG05_NODE_668_length_8004_cov_3.894371_9_plen_358_part_00
MCTPPPHADASLQLALARRTLLPLPIACPTLICRAPPVAKEYYDQFGGGEGEMELPPVRACCNSQDSRQWSFLFDTTRGQRHWEQKWFRFTFFPAFDEDGDTDIRWKVDPERSDEDAEDIHVKEEDRQLPKSAAAALAKEWYDHSSEFAGTYTMVLPPRNIYHPTPKHGGEKDPNAWAISFDTEPSSLSEAFLTFEVASRYTVDHDAVQWVMVKPEEAELLHRFQERDEQILLDRAQKACPPPSVLAQAEEIEHDTLRKGMLRAKLKGLTGMAAVGAFDVVSPSKKLKEKAEKDKEKHLNEWYERKIADTHAPEGVLASPRRGGGGAFAAAAEAKMTAGQRIRRSVRACMLSRRDSL